VKRDNRREERLNNPETRYEGHKPRDKRLGKEKGDKEERRKIQLLAYSASVITNY
jgi:hypothetical protein